MGGRSICLSNAEPDFHDYIRGKDVALVVAGGSLQGRRFGSTIDSHEIVARINGPWPITDDIIWDLGSRTDVWFVTVWRHDIKRKHFRRASGRLKWLIACAQGKYRLGKKWGVFTHRDVQCRVHHTSLDRAHMLRKVLVPRASNGMIAMAELLYAGAASLSMYGFTFLFHGDDARPYHDGYRQEHLNQNCATTRRTAKWHNFRKELGWFKTLLACESRIKVDAGLKNVLEATEKK
jgi:hypothetical protein